MTGAPSAPVDLGLGQPNRTRRRARGPVAVVDIGSNSVRLVVYESLSRTPATVHNEKSICAIGREMVTTGRLHADGMKQALEALLQLTVSAGRRALFSMLVQVHLVRPVREIHGDAMRVNRR